MKNLRLALVFYITLLSSFQLSNSLFQPQFSFPSHDSANPIKTLIGNLSHVLEMASRERNIRKHVKWSYISFSKRHFHTMHSSKNFITLPGLFLLFSSCLLTESSQNGYYKGTSLFQNFTVYFQHLKSV